MCGAPVALEVALVCALVSSVFLLHCPVFKVLTTGFVADPKLKFENLSTNQTLPSHSHCSSIAGASSEVAFAKKMHFESKNLSSMRMRQTESQSAQALRGTVTK